MRLIIADDHPLFLEAVRLEIAKSFPAAEIVATHSVEGAQGLLGDGARPDFVLLDYAMPGMGGAQGIADFVVRAGGAPVVVMSGVADPGDVQACIAAGARGFLPKTLDPGLFGSVLQIIAAGGSYVPVEFTAGAAKPTTKPGLSASSFSERELNILRMVVDGMSNKEIARALNFQEVTIKVNLTRIFDKLGAKNRTQAAKIVLGMGILG